jgi:hypothetical protein
VINGRKRIVREIKYLADESWTSSFTVLDKSGVKGIYLGPGTIDYLPYLEAANALITASTVAINGEPRLSRSLKGISGSVVINSDGQ